MINSFNPLQASENIVRSYRNYLLSAFEFSSDLIQDGFAKALDSEFSLSRGPFLQVTPPYKRGKSLENLIRDGVLHPHFARLDSTLLDDGAPVLPLQRPLYEHQVESIEKVVKGKNLIVATGTGSGKTEAFLLPVINHLLREEEKGTLTEPGVRALLLYPMNALANDQVKRLRQLLTAFPKITFGRYIGDTRADTKTAREQYHAQYGEEPLENELVSREQIQQNPPHILITNFAMLEYLLLRPEDTSLFDGESGQYWKFIVLDEVHTYQGAQGGEIAMLLKRVRDRVHASRKSEIQYIGTSATIGDSQEKSVARRIELFGKGLFDEAFNVSSNVVESDVVSPQYENLLSAEPLWTSTSSEIENLTTALVEDTNATGKTAIIDAIKKLSSALDIKISSQYALNEQLGYLMLRDANYHKLTQYLRIGSAELPKLAHELFGSAERADLVRKFVDICTYARVPGEEINTLSARYHVMLRALEGLFACFSKNHRDGASRVFLERHEKCPICSDDGFESATFELAPCQQCGSHYIVGTRSGITDQRERISQAEVFNRELEYFSFAEDEAADIDDDELLVETSDEMADTYEVCLECGEIDESKLSCGHHPSSARRARVSRPKEVGLPLRTCINCSGRTTGQMVSRVQTGQDAPGAVIAAAIYQQLPPSNTSGAKALVGEGRKLLTFSDSRQDAAFFAPYLERTYSKTIQRNLIYRTLAKKSIPLQFNDLVQPIQQLATDYRVLNPLDSAESRRTEVSKWLCRELLATDRRLSVSGVGLIDIRPSIRPDMHAPSCLLSAGLSAKDALATMQFLLNTLREQAVMTIPDGVDIEDEIFSPRNVVVGMKEFSEKGILGWRPQVNKSNRRYSFFSKLRDVGALSTDPDEILQALWVNELRNPNSVWSTFLVTSRNRAGVDINQLDYARFEFAIVQPDEQLAQCVRCKQISWTNIANVCTRHQCSGSLKMTPPDAARKGGYRNQYQKSEPNGMSVEEHTGQLSNDYAAEVQYKFAEGQINVLSCSTTFELGVDLGEIQAVLMKNVPPSPANYVQRAGRAGRRLNSAALAITFAQRRSHDLYYFNSPDELVNGRVRAPQISTDNVRIQRRHLHSVALAAFARHVSSTGREWPKYVGEFFVTKLSGGPDVTLADEFRKWLESRPSDLDSALRRLFPDPAIDSELGISDWSWVALLYEFDDVRESGWMTRAAAEVVSELTELQNLIKEKQTELGALDILDKKGKAITALLMKLRNYYSTLFEKRLLDYLATRVVIPKYGFPVDVVEMDVWQSGNERSGKVELTRDLRIGILDFAPTAETVAAKRIWQSTGLRVPPNKALEPVKWAECADCGTFRREPREAEITQCPVCQSEKKKGGAMPAIKPTFGFYGTMSTAKPGEARPQRVGYVTSYFSDYEGVSPQFESEKIGKSVLETRTSRQGRITVLNRGPRGRGFDLCLSCGFAQLPKEKSKRTKSQSEIRTHTRPGIGGRECSSTTSIRYLAHEYLTDTIELVIPGINGDEDAWSVLSAILASTQHLGISANDVSGTVRAHGPGGKGKSLVIFDSVPGGAGYSRQIRESLPELLGRALQVVSQCECGEETSCYGCLKSYQNQARHDLLERRRALQVLESLGIK